MIVVQEYNEFTWDMVRALPTCYYLEVNKIEYTLSHKPNLSSLYYFVKNKQEVNKFSPHNPHDTYSLQGPHLQNWLPPPIKKDFQGILNFQKPTLVINNKYSKEWQRSPKNFIDIETLDCIFSKFKDQYQILYIRPKQEKSKDYYHDENEVLEFNDYQFIKENHPEVTTIYDLLDKNNDLNFNTMQFAMHATSDKHISVSGGNACLSAYFGGHLIIYDVGCNDGSIRGIWKSNSWLSKLSGSKITGIHSREDLQSYVNKEL